MLGFPSLRQNAGSGDGVALKFAAAKNTVEPRLPPVVTA
jgi:hypothetical protein